jgi:hypothetical protein
MFANLPLIRAYVVGWHVASPFSLDERGAEPTVPDDCLVLTGFMGLVVSLMLSYTTMPWCSSTGTVRWQLSQYINVTAPSCLSSTVRTSEREL